LLHADEGFWAGDRAAEGKLKDMVTGDRHFIEFKGKEAFPVANYVRLLVTGNPDWLVPAGFEERRFAVLDCGEHHMRDIPYFAAIAEEMGNDGREALLAHLLAFDLSKVDLRTIPTTAALLDQKFASLDPEKGWWLDVLSRGELPSNGCDSDNFVCPKGRLFDQYIEHAQQQGARRRAIETQIGMFLRKYVPGLQTKRIMVSGKQAWVYEFPPLAECREAFAKLMGQDFAWDDVEEWQEQTEVG
jgi:hypothetical protein